MNLTNPFIELGKHQGRQEGFRQGRQEGRHQGEAELVLKLLVRRLGPLSAAQVGRIRQLDLRKIEALGVALLEFQSGDDLSCWLRQKTSKARRTRRISKN